MPSGRTAEVSTKSSLPSPSASTIAGGLPLATTIPDP
jgi:hypothetical protein